MDRACRDGLFAVKKVALRKEENSMYKHCDIGDKNISLHDCHATNIFYENRVITFIFPDGIWVTNEHPSNELGKTVRTDMAEVKLYLDSESEDDITVYIFEEKFKKTFREEWELSKLMEHVNNKNCTLEFLYQYKGYNSMIIKCWLWSNKKPYHRECELKLLLKDVKYCWNKLRK